MVEIDHRKKKRDYTQTLDDTQKQIILQYIKDYEAFLISIAKNISTKCPKLEVEDIKQQLIYVLLASIKHYDGRLGSAYSTYLSQIALNEGKTIVRRYWQDKNKVNAMSVSLDDYIRVENNGRENINVVFEDDAVESNPISVYERNLVTQKIKKVARGLSKTDRKSFFLYLEGYTILEISRMLKCSKTRVYQVIKKVKSIYEKELNQGEGK